MFRAMDLENPGEVNVLGFYLNVPIKDESMGASLYISKPPHESEELDFIGAVANARPSDIFHTGWSVNPSVNVHSSIKLVVKPEPLENIKSLVELKESNHITQTFAMKVAKNLFNFLESFNNNPNNDGILHVPGNIFNKWYEKFKTKFKYDPNFVFNTD